MPLDSKEQLNGRESENNNNIVHLLKRGSSSAGGDARSHSRSCFIPSCPYSPPSPLFSISLLKDRFKKLLAAQYPNIAALAASASDGGLRCCLAHLKQSLQARADELVEEDLTEFAKFQDTVMKDLEGYELGENHWQDQFDRARSFGEKAADNVAKFGGSWGFIFVLGGMIGTWAILNCLLSTPWDPYPFILLNLILSMLASTQAPVIMMSQHRQAAIDRLQTDYVSKAILRNENQTKHVDAKLDHLISYQWKRLLEIQEIQIQLLQEVIQADTHSINSISSPVLGGGGKKRTFWSGESVNDTFTKYLLQKVRDGYAAGDGFIFSHWHMEGDNFTGDVRNVNLSIHKENLKSISFEIHFSNKATLDDILQGEVNVTLRNDFNLPQMNLLGRISTLKLINPASTTTTSTFTNGDFPPRYKPTFVRNRTDRITETWKTHFDGVVVTYTPPPPFTIIHLPKGTVLRGCSLSSHTPVTTVFYTTVQKVEYEADQMDRWTKSACVEVEGVGVSPVYEVTFPEEISGPGYVLLGSDAKGRVGWNGVVEKESRLGQQSELEMLKEELLQMP